MLIKSNNSKNNKYIKSIEIRDNSKNNKYIKSIEIRDNSKY